MNALDVVARSVTAPFFKSRRSFGINDWLNLWNPDSGAVLLNQTLPGDREEVSASFEGYVRGIYQRNGVVFACVAARMRLFSEARFQFQQLRGGKPGALFGTPDLQILETPEPGMVTGDLTSQAEGDAIFAGNWFGVRRGNRIKRLRPDWTSIALGSTNPDAEFIEWDPDTTRIGYGFHPGGYYSGKGVQPFLAEEVAHYRGEVDPLAQYRGMSLITPILREIMADNSATSHKLASFRNAVTPNMVVKFPPALSKDAAEEFIELFDQEHRGALNAYKTIYLGGGADATVVGQTFQQMTFKELQGNAETRIAAATGMHPVVVALSEGLAGSSLNSGNFNAAKRAVADVLLMPRWRNFAGSIQVIVPPPVGSRMWFDVGDVAFLRDDSKDQAEITQAHATSINTLVNSGMDPATVIDAVTSGDLTRLTHTGLVSVQLQPPGTQAPARARSDFWPSSGPFATIGTVERGTELPSEHPLVRAFPSMFERAEAPVQIGAGPIVTREQVIEKRRELIAAGKFAGRESLARELNVSPSTIKRRLGEA